MPSFICPTPRVHLGNPLRASARADGLLMCGDVTQCCGNVLLFIKRREMEKTFPTQRNAFSLFPLIKEQRCKCNQPRRQRVGVRVSSEENILRVNG